MSKTITVKPDKNDFNYASVDAETAAKLEYFAKSLKSVLKKSQIQFIADVGKILSEARQALSHKGDGTFIKWAVAEFDMSKDTVYRYVNSWDRTLSHGATNYLNWSPTALYLASADDFPKPVLKKLEKIPPTELVRTSDVKRLIEANKPKPEPEPESNSDDEDLFATAAALTPAQKKKADAEAAKQKKKDEAAAAAQAKKEKAAADREAKKIADAAEKAKKKEEAKAAKKKEREEAAAAKLKALPKDEQIKLIKSHFQQHIDRAVRLVDEFAHLKQTSNANKMAIIRNLQGIKLW